MEPARITRQDGQPSAQLQPGLETKPRRHRARHSPDPSAPDEQGEGLPVPTLARATSTRSSYKTALPIPEEGFYSLKVVKRALRLVRLQLCCETRLERAQWN